MAMVESWEVNKRLIRKTWFAEPLGRKWDLKIVKQMKASILEKLGGRGIRFATTIEDYDVVISMYCQSLTDYCNTAFAKGKPLGNAIPSTTETDASEGRNAFNADPCLIKPELDATRDKLSSGAKQVHKFLTSALDQFLLYMLKEILEPEIMVIVTKRLRHERNRDRTLTWKLIVPWVRNVLTDVAPRMLSQSLFAMTRPNGFSVKRWTAAHQTLRLDLLAKGQSFLPSVSYPLWANQITPAEWLLVADGKVFCPKTSAEVLAFKISKYAGAADAVADELWADFDLFSPANKKIIEFQATLLVNPAYVTSRVFPIYDRNDPNSKRTTGKKQKKQKDKKTSPHHPGSQRTAADNNDGEGYQCDDCEKWHAPGQHTKAGRAKYQQRHAERKNNGSGSRGRGRGNRRGRGRGRGGRGRGRGRGRGN